MIFQNDLFVEFDRAFIDESTEFFVSIFKDFEDKKIPIVNDLIPDESFDKYFDYSRQTFFINLQDLFLDFNVYESGKYLIEVSGRKRVLDRFIVDEISPEFTELKIKIDGNVFSGSDDFKNENALRSNFISYKNSEYQTEIIPIVYSKFQTDETTEEEFLYIKLIEPIDQENSGLYIFKEEFKRVVDNVYWFGIFDLINDNNNASKIIELPPADNFLRSNERSTSFENMVSNVFSASVPFDEDIVVVPTFDFLSISNAVFFSHAKTLLDDSIEHFQKVYEYQTNILEYESGSNTPAISSSSYYALVSKSEETFEEYLEYVEKLSSFEKFQIWNADEDNIFSYPKEFHTESNYFQYILDNPGGYTESSTDVGDWYALQKVVAKQSDRQKSSGFHKNLPDFYFLNTVDPYGLLWNFIQSTSQFLDDVYFHAKSLFYLHLKDEYGGVGNVSNKYLNKSISDDGFELRNPYEYTSLYNWLVKRNNGSFSTIDNIAYRDLVMEFWRRLGVNLNYLYKTKGTFQSIFSFLNIFGMPSSILNINERVKYFGSDTFIPNETAKTKMIEEKYFDTNNISYILIDTFDQIVTSSNEFCIEFQAKSTLSRFNTKTLASESSVLISTDELGDNSCWNLTLEQIAYNSGSTDLILNWYSGSSWNTQSLIEDIPMLDKSFVQFAVNFEQTGSLWNVDAYSFYYVDGIKMFTKTGSTSSCDIPSMSVYDDLYLATGSHSSALPGGNHLTIFDGGFREFRYWNTQLDSESIKLHAIQYDSMRIVDNQNNFGTYLNSNYVRYKLDGYYESSGSIYILDSSLRYREWNHGLLYNVSQSLWPIYQREIIDFGMGIGSDLYGNKIRIVEYENPENRLDELVGKINIKRVVKIRDSNVVDILFSPAELINYDIYQTLSGLNLNSIMAEYYGTEEYIVLKSLKNSYFKRWTQNYFNYNDYIRIVKQFGNVFFNSIDQIIPMRVKLNKGLVVKNHVLFKQRNPVKQSEIDTETLNTQSLNLVKSVESTQYNSLIYSGFDRLPTCSINHSSLYEPNLSVPDVSPNDSLLITPIIESLSNECLLNVDSISYYSESLETSSLSKTTVRIDNSPGTIKDPYSSMLSRKSTE